MSLALCVIAGGKTTVIAAAAFSLSWTHSVERTLWQENWAVTPAGLEMREARVKGSGAGMEPGEGARLVDGWWVWTPDAPAVPELTLAASGLTPSPWRLCHAGGCMTIGETSADPATLRPCDN